MTSMCTIEAFSRRVHLTAWSKFHRLPGNWLKTQGLEDVTIWYD
ncbi:MAG: hypothetical protein ACOY16_09560 [Chloroflexota bacterium]